MNEIRPCAPGELSRILDIINAAAMRYRGVIPDHHWHEPYMSLEELERDISAGVSFLGHYAGNELVAVMGAASVGDVTLVRHAYVLPQHQGGGLGSKLLERIKESSMTPVLVGTWAAAQWAIRFYRRNGFEQVEADAARRLLGSYWTISQAQAECSVVLSYEPR